MGAGVLLRTGTAQAALGFSLTGLGACLLLLARDLGVPVGRLAWLPAGFGFGLLLVAAAGPLLMRPGPRPALRGGALTLAAGAALLATAAGPAAASAGALLLGVGGAAIVLVTPALLAGPGAAARLTKVYAAASASSVVGPALVGAVDASGVAGGRLAMLVVVPPLVALAVAPGGPPTAAAAPGTPAGASGPPPEGRQVAVRWTRIVLAVAVEFCFTIWAAARLYETGVSAATAAVLGAAFPVGMALGRLSGPVLVRLPGLVPLSALTTAAGAVGVVAADRPAVVTAALAVAGAGVATLYPVTLADLVATPNLRQAHAASLGALASGVAILGAPTGLAAVAGAAGMRAAFLVTLPVLAALVALRPRAQRVRAGG